MEPAKKKFLMMAFILLCLLAISIVFAPMFGSVYIKPSEFIEVLTGKGEGGVDATLIFQSRIPRVLLAILAGAGLATSGAVLQSLLRNPLADPFTLGVASGGAFGAGVAIIFGSSSSILGMSSSVLFSMAGSLLTLLLIIAGARWVGLSSGSIILAGVSLNIIFTSLILFLQYLSDISQSHLIVRWLMGEVDVWGMQKVTLAGMVIILGVIASIFISGRLNHLLTGDILAEARGINVKKLFFISIIITSLMTGAIVSVCGPIGFVGLVVPHIVRLSCGYDNRLVIPLSAPSGALLLVLCDAVARTIVAPAEIPVGVITSIIGGTSLVFLLTFRRNAMGM